MFSYSLDADDLAGLLVHDDCLRRPPRDAGLLEGDSIAPEFGEFKALEGGRAVRLRDVVVLAEDRAPAEVEPADEAHRGEVERGGLARRRDALAGHALLPARAHRGLFEPRDEGAPAVAVCHLADEQEVARVLREVDVRDRLAAVEPQVEAARQTSALPAPVAVRADVIREVRQLELESLRRASGSFFGLLEVSETLRLRRGRARPVLRRGAGREADE